MAKDQIKARMNRQVPAGLDLRDDGTAVVQAAGRRIVLRRPTFGELRTLREMYASIEDETVRLRAKSDEARPERPEDAGPTAMGEWLIEVRRGRTSLVDAYEELYRGWTGQAVATLGDGPLPETVDEWDPWLMQPELAQLLIEHWRSVPLAPGAS